ncbi:hypothetical protein RDI58_011057 [Solanum bulbocastanum]|uniref:Granulins domain-containing protein n=1 Tax=Solanum bulbocastanum TaxID=147425 RepID=A0AAN8TXF8_SOLBU
MEPSYPLKNGANPPNPSPSPPSPVAPSTVCDEYYRCTEGTICCCIYKYGDYCFGWGCCPYESATCCDDNNSCCPHDYPVCDVNAGTCQMSKDSPLNVKALKRSPATARVNSSGPYRFLLFRRPCRLLIFLRRRSRSLDFGFCVTNSLCLLPLHCEFEGRC